MEGGAFQSGNGLSVVSFRLSVKVGGELVIVMGDGRVRVQRRGHGETEDTEAGWSAAKFDPIRAGPVSG